MRRAYAYLTSGFLVLVGVSSASAGPYDWFREGMSDRFLGGLTDEQKTQLREIGAEFIAETRQYAPAMREAGEQFMAALKAQWVALSDEQKTKAREFMGKMRTLPRRERFAMAMKLLGAVDISAVAGDVTSMLKAETAEARVAAGENLLWHAVEVLGAILEGEVGISQEQLASISSEIHKVLDSTREERVAVQRILDAKLEAAASVLTSVDAVERASSTSIGRMSLGGKR